MKRISGAVALALAMGVTIAPAQAHNHGGKSHHRFWAVHGTVVSQSLAKNDDGTYSGDVVVEAKHWDRRARHNADMSSGNQGGQKTFTLDHAKVKLRVSDTGDGKIDQDDVVPGDRVLLAGKSDRSHRRCDTNHDGSASGTKNIRWAAFADPKTEQSKRR